MERLKTGIITIYNHKKLALIALTALTTAGRYLWTYCTQGSKQADKYFDSQTKALRAKVVTLSDSLFNYTEDLVLAETPDVFDHIVKNIMDKARALASEHREAGLDLAEAWVDKIQNTLQDHADAILGAKNNTEVFKILRKVLKKLTYSADEIPPKLDVLLDEVVNTVSDQLDDIVKARTSADTQALIRKVIENLATIKNINTAQTLQEQIGAILIAHEQEMTNVKDSNSLNKFLEAFKETLVIAVADKIYDTDAEDYAAENTDAMHNNDEAHILGEKNEDTQDL